MKKYSVSVSEKYCKACGICIGLCTKGVYHEDYLGKAVVKERKNVADVKFVNFIVPISVLR